MLEGRLNKGFTATTVGWGSALYNARRGQSADSCGSDGPTRWITDKTAVFVRYLREAYNLSGRVPSGICKPEEEYKLKWLAGRATMGRSDSEAGVENKPTDAVRSVPSLVRPCIRQF